MLVHLPSVSAQWGCGFSTSAFHHTGYSRLCGPIAFFFLLESSKSQDGQPTLNYEFHTNGENFVERVRSSVSINCVRRLLVQVRSPAELILHLQSNTYEPLVPCLELL